jgi:cupin 2 domain-containing protein
MTAVFGSALADLPAALHDEAFDTLAASGGTRFERIVSAGQASPPGFWYDEPWDEFVAILTGGATLEIEGETPRAMGPGDWVFLPAHCRHRVAWTDPEVKTVWLAVHVGEPR